MTGLDADRLARANLWRCPVIAQWMTRRRPWLRDEAESVGLVALAEAIRDFDPNRGTLTREISTRFAAYADHSIRNRIVMFLRLGVMPKGYRSRDASRRAKRPEVTGLAEAGSWAIEPPAAAGPVGWEIEWGEHVDALADRLPAEHGAVFRRRLLDADAQTFTAVGEPLGMSRFKTQRLYREALEILRTHHAEFARGA